MSERSESLSPCINRNIGNSRPRERQTSKSITTRRDANERSDRQPSNTKPHTCESVESGSNMTRESFSHFLKHVGQSVRIEEGMQIDGSDEQLSNAPSPTPETRDPDSNMTSERASHRKKQDFGTTFVDEGIIIGRTDKHNLNADSPRFEMLQPGPNGSAARPQFSKHLFRIVFTDDGRTKGVTCQTADKCKVAKDRKFRTGLKPQVRKIHAIEET
jgi:hypothetical protein